MIFKWFDARAAKAFGEELARFYVGRIPADAALSQKQFAAKTAETLRKMEEQVMRFRKDNPLNVYSKAQLGNAFRWALKDAGYDDAYIERLVDWLVTKV